MKKVYETNAFCPVFQAFQINDKLDQRVSDASLLSTGHSSVIMTETQDRHLTPVVSDRRHAVWLHWSSDWSSSPPPHSTVHTLLCHAMHDALHCEFVTRAKRKDKPSLINPGIKSSKHSYTYTESCWLSWCRGERNLCTSL